MKNLKLTYEFTAVIAYQAVIVRSRSEAAFYVNRGDLDEFSRRKAGDYESAEFLLERIKKERGLNEKKR